MTASAPGGSPRTHVRRDLKSRGHAAGGGGAEAATGIALEDAFLC